MAVPLMNKLWGRMLHAFTAQHLAWAEVMVMALISFYLWVDWHSTVANSAPPNFFWPLLAPLLIALRYGFAKGLLCALFSMASFALTLKIAGTLGAFPFSLAVGTVVTVMIAGEFRDYWHKVNQKHRLADKCMQQKLACFTQHYQLLKVSHEQLEQRTAGQIISLRGEVELLQNIASKHADRRLQSLAEPLLSLFANIGGMQVAGIYQVTANKLEQQSYAVLGEQHLLKNNDPMLRAMLMGKKLLSPAKLSANEAHQSRYQLCIPFIDTEGTLQAAILAENVNFFSLTPDNIALLSLLSGLAGDLLNEQLFTPILEPHQIDLFTLYVQRARFHKEHYGVNSRLVVFIDPTGTHKDILNLVGNYRRGSDVYWSSPPHNHHSRLAVLLPLTTASDALDYLERVKGLLASYLGERVSEIDILGPFAFDKDQHEIDGIMNELGACDEKMVVISNTSM